jgi:hypothetical protein
VPWDIYQNLNALYKIMLGHDTFIIENSGDWLEAVVGLTIWGLYGSDTKRHKASRREQLAKLADSFRLATNSVEELRVQTFDPVEVGLASILEGDVESAITVITLYSLTVSAAAAEVASSGGWLPKREESQQFLTMGESLDENDMEVLGLNQGQQSKSNDIMEDILINYARGLVRKPFQNNARGEAVDGWEYAIHILARLDSEEHAKQEVADVVDQIELENDKIVNKLWGRLCNARMGDEARRIVAVCLISLSYGNLLTIAEICG